MIRVVLAVLLAAALVGASMTALDHARRSRSATLADGQAGRLADAIGNLHRSETPVGSADDAARRVVDVSVPTGGFTTAPLSFVAVGGVPGRSLDGDTDDRDAIAYAVAGGPTHVAWVPVDVRVADSSAAGDRVSLADDDEPLVLSNPATLVLSLLERGGRPVVLVHRR